MRGGRKNLRFSADTALAERDTSRPLVSTSKTLYKVVQKTDTQFYFWDNFGNSAPILTILSLLQAEIYGA